MLTVQLTVEKGYDTKMEMHTETCTSDVGLAREFIKHLSNAYQKHGVIYKGKYKKLAGKQS